MGHSFISSVNFYLVLIVGKASFSKGNIGYKTKSTLQKVQWELRSKLFFNLGGLQTKGAFE